jgi:hypothetical protein
MEGERRQRYKGGRQGRWDGICRRWKKSGGYENGTGKEGAVGK